MSRISDIMPMTVLMSMVSSELRTIYSGPMQGREFAEVDIGYASTCPSICSASLGASSTLQMWTPPCKPLLNLPSPLPPAKIWLFTTTCSAEG